MKQNKIVKLIDVTKRVVRGESLLEFIIYGLKYVFPAEPGMIVRGIPTAHSAYPLNEKIKNTREKYVWQFPKGPVRGQIVEPLYYTVPSVAPGDKFFYELLALTDAIRIGRERERNIAIEELSKRLELF